MTEAPIDPARAARIANAHADRIVLLPTAYTHPKGTVYFSSYEIIVLQAGYAFADDSQLSVTATPPLGEDPIFPLDVSLKTRFVDEPRVRAAVIGSATGIVGIEEGQVFLGRVGGTAQLCFDDGCGSSLSFAQTLIFAGPIFLAVGGAGGIFELTDWLSFIGEGGVVLPIGRDGGQVNGAMANLGFRLPYKNWSLDLAAAVPAESDIALLPFIAFTYRFLPD